MQVTKIDGKTINFPQLRGSLAGLRYPVLAEIKYDGEFNYIVLKNKDLYTINKYGTMRRDFPALNAIGELLDKLEVDSVVLVCEVYWNEGKLGALYELLSHKKDDDIKLCIFDIIELNGDNLKDYSLIDRKEILLDLKLGNTPRCLVCEDKTEVTMAFDSTVSQGYEGIVVKALDGGFISGPCSWVKIKKKDRTDYPVVVIDSIKERIEVAVPTPMDTLGKIGKIHVGVKAPNRYKKHIKLGDMVTIEHQGVLKSGSLRHPVLIPKKGW